MSMVKHSCGTPVHDFANGSFAVVRFSGLSKLFRGGGLAGGGVVGGGGVVITSVLPQPPRMSPSPCAFQTAYKNRGTRAGFKFSH